MDCASIYFDHLSNCNDEIVVRALLVPGTSYTWLIINHFGQEYTGTAAADADGFIHIPIADLPDGMLNEFSGEFTLRILDGDCTALSFKMADIYDTIRFRIGGGSRIKNTIGCDFQCVSAGEGARNAFFPFTAADTVHIEWTSLLEGLYGNSPEVSVYHLIAPNVYEKANVVITLNGGPYDLESIDVDNGGPNDGYVLITS